MDNKLNEMEERIERREINAVDFKEYEEWLESMEAEGWNLKSVDMNYDHTFVKGEPRKIRYCLDYREENKKEYVKMFKDFGWKLIYLNYTDFLWAKEYEGERPEAFDTMESLIEKNKSFKKRLGRNLLSLALMILLLAFDYKGLTIIVMILFMFILPGDEYLYYWGDWKFLKAYYKNKKLIEEGTN